MLKKLLVVSIVGAFASLTPAFAQAPDANAPAAEAEKGAPVKPAKHKKHKHKAKKAKAESTETRLRTTAQNRVAVAGRDLDLAAPLPALAPFSRDLIRAARPTGKAVGPRNGKGLDGSYPRLPAHHVWRAPHLGAAGIERAIIRSPPRDWRSCAMHPAGDAPLLDRRALMLNRACAADVGPIAAHIEPVSSLAKR